MRTLRWIQGLEMMIQSMVHHYLLFIATHNLNNRIVGSLDIGHLKF